MKTRVVNRIPDVVGKGRKRKEEYQEVLEQTRKLQPGKTLCIEAVTYAEYLGIYRLFDKYHKHNGYLMVGRRHGDKASGLRDVYITRLSTE